MEGSLKGIEGIKEIKGKRTLNLLDVIRAIKSDFPKWTQTIVVSWSNYLVYRLNFFLQIIGPTIVFFFIKYNLWTSIYAKTTISSTIQGYTLSQMLHYHLWVMVVSLLGQGHNSMNLSEDIRLGRISKYLIYPFRFWEFHTAQFLAFQILQLLVTLITLLVVGLVGRGVLQSIHPLFILQGLLFTLLVGFFWFIIQYMIGLLSFWLEETWVLRVLFMVIAQFFSGSLIPLEFFPAWWTQAMMWTPFPYLTFVPVKIFMGQPLLVGRGVAVLLVWMGIFIATSSAIWRRGLRHYTAAGI